jgi:hypothetical protein
MEVNEDFCRAHLVVLSLARCMPILKAHRVGGARPSTRNSVDLSELTAKAGLHNVEGHSHIATF